MDTVSGSDEELPLDSTDLEENLSSSELVSPTINVQPTDAVEHLLAKARDTQEGGDPAIHFTPEQKSILSEADQTDLNPSPATGTEDEFGSSQVDWENYNLHVFVLSEAGKPVYSRYGDVVHLASIMGVMQALVSFVATTGDELHSIEAGTRTFVFLSRPPLILVAIGLSTESRAHLVVILSYVYNQILSLLTLKRLKQRFEFQKNLDLRLLLHADNRLISSIVDFSERTLAGFLQATGYLPMAQNSRDQFAQIISQSVKSPTVVFGVLFHRKHVITLVSMRGQNLLPMDLHLIINLISTSEQLKSGQTYWLPICLPQFDANGFLYAHVSSLDEATSLVLLSVDSAEFYTLDQAKDKIFERLRSTNGGELLRTVAAASFPTLSSLAAPELRHLVCKCVPVSQYISTDWASLYVDHVISESGLSGTEIPSGDNPRLPASIVTQFTADSQQSREEILRTYRRIHSRLHNPDYPTRLVYQSTQTEAFVGWKIDIYEFYCTLEPLTSKSTVNEIRKVVLRWVQSHKTQLFALSSPTF